jgi:hypothetical protein
MHLLQPLDKERTMRVGFRWSGVLLLALSVQACVIVGRGGWELLGQRNVDFGHDRDTIEVGRAEGRFHQLRFSVTGGDIELFDMQVTFGDGQTFHPEVRMHFEEGENSRAIDLPGGARVIRRVDFLYRSTSHREGRGMLSLFGR